MIMHPDFKNDVFYGDRSCCTACLLFKENGTVSLPMTNFLRQNRNILQFVNYTSATDIRLEQADGKFVLKNFSMIEKIINFGVEILYEAAEPI